MTSHPPSDRENSDTPPAGRVPQASHGPGSAPEGACFASALARVRGSRRPDARDLETLLVSEDAAEDELLFSEARRTRDEECGRRMVLRGLVEFSSYCGNSCRYCGLNRGNRKAARYRLSPEEILGCAARIAQAGIRTIVLQSGEDGMPAPELARIVGAIKSRHDMAVTLSVGERPRKDYALWRDAGADRYLLRVESVDPKLYASWHADRILSTRLRCLDELRDLGYQVGSGMMIGTPGQTAAHIARDIRFLAERDFDMIGIGAFIPHPDTPMGNAPRGDIGLTLRAVALTRLVNRNAWMPATTAVGSLDRDYRVDALNAGANVVMPNFSPEDAKGKYAIYPGKRCLSERSGDAARAMERMAEEAGLALDYSRADSLKSVP